MECDVRKSKNDDVKSERFKLMLDSSNVNSLINKLLNNSLSNTLS